MFDDTKISACCYVLSTCGILKLLQVADSVFSSGDISVRNAIPLGALGLVCVTVAAVHVLADKHIMRRQMLTAKETSSTT